MLAHPGSGRSQHISMLLSIHPQHGVSPPPLDCHHLPCLQKVCWPKHPSGWQIVEAEPGLVSGMVSALTVNAFTPQASPPPPPPPPPPVAQPPPDAGLPLNRSIAPLFGDHNFDPASVPPGVVYGKCLVLPNRCALFVSHRWWSSRFLARCALRAGEPACLCCLGVVMCRASVACTHAWHQ